MFLEILLFTFLGIGVGVVTGLIPGLHPNTVFVMILSLTFFLAQIPTPMVLAFVISLAISNTFTDFLPSILFGAPDPATALSVLPGHRFLLAGKAYEALFLTVIGGLGVAVLTLITMPLLLYLIPQIYNSIHTYLHMILLFIVLWMVLTERGMAKLYSLFIFILVGLFGFVSLNSLPSEMVLFPALTGLFAFSTLIISFHSKSTIPEQEETREIKGNHIKGILTGWLAGWLAGILPGIGAAQAGVIAAQVFRAKIRDFLTALGGINTANILFTFIVFYTLGKTRSGAMWTVSQLVDKLTFNDMLLISVVGAITCFISAILTLKIGKILIRRMKNVNYKRLNLSIIITLIVLVFIFTGWVGLFISLLGTCMGLLTILLGVRRSHLMGFLILPTILYFSGLGIFLGLFLGI
ncbi:MAG: tripartite tricarboxylate transporter permease [Candidatus Aenigmarchaeota archaeon]|nr:tripartite tricarboxylate transporter permease [Candidatus Aenigmarchaeota archaeon]